MLTPRWLGLLAVVLVLGAAFVRLGAWQLAVAQEDAGQQALSEAAARPVVTLDEAFAPHAPFPPDGSNQRVRALGHYEPERLVYVPERRLGGVEGRWVVVPFVAASTGARIPVVRGFVAGSAPFAAAASGMPPAPTTSGWPPDPSAAGAPAQLTLVGSLAPTESPRAARSPLRSGEIGSVDVGALLNDWGGQIYNGFLFAISETPDPGDVAPAGATAAPGAPAGLMERVPPPALPTGLTLRNAAYALQWWVFAAFGLWMWWKMVRDDHRRRPLDRPVEEAGATP
jgi:cytochrome oxidase assembly protein ShyY1